MVVKKGTKEYAAAVAAYKQYWARQQANNQAMLQQSLQPIDNGPANAGGVDAGLVTSPGQANPLANSLASLNVGGGYEGNTKAPDENILKKLANGGMDAGSRVLDVLSRGTYMSANAAKAFKESKYGKSDKLSDLDNYAGDILKGAWRGLSGKDKTTYADVIKSGDKATKSDAVGGFVLDVALDPTTYIGPGLIKAGVKAGAKGLEKLGVEGAGKVVSKLDAKRAEEVALASKGKVNPSDIRVDGNASGFAPPEGSSSLRLPDHMEPIGPQRQPQSNFNTVAAKPERIANTAPPAPVLEQAAPEVTKIPNIERNQRMLAASSDISRIMGDIEKARPNKYAPDTALAAPFKETEKVVNALKPFDRAGIDKLSYRVAVLSDDTFPIIKGSNGKVVRVGDLKKYVAQAASKGDAAALKNINDALNRAVDAAMQNPELRARLDRSPIAGGNTDDLAAVTIFGRDGNVMGSHTPATLARLLSGEDKLKRGMKVSDDVFGIDPTDIDNLHVRANTNGVPVPLRNLLDRVQGISRDANGKVVKAGAKVKSSERLSGDELNSWMEQAAKVVDPADLGPLMNAKTADEFAKGLQKIIKTEKVKDFETPADLAEKLKGAQTALERAKSEPEWLEKVAEAKTPEQIDRVNAAASVPTAEEVIKDVAEKGPAIFDRPVTELTAEQSDAVEAALQHFISRDMLAPLLGKDNGGEYVFTTHGGTKRTADKLNEGLGRNVKQFNEFSQGATVARPILAAAVDMLTPAERQLTDVARGAAIRKYAEPMLDAAWNALDAKGIRSIGGLEDKGIALALPDILKQFPDEVVNKYFYDSARQILPSVWVRMAKAMIEHPGDPNLPKMIESMLTSKVGRAGGGVSNPLVSSTGRANQASMRQALSAAKKSGKAINPTDEFNSLVKNRTAKAVEALTKPEVIANVVKANNISSARYAIESGARVTSIEQRVLDTIQEAITDPNISPAELIRRLSDQGSDVAKATAKEVGARGDELPRAKANVKAQVDELVPADDLKTVSAAAKATDELKVENWGKGSFGGPKPAERVKSIETRRASVGRTIPETKIADEVVDVDDIVALRNHNRFSRIIWGTGSKFSTHMGTGGLRNEELRNMGAYMGLARTINQKLGGIHDAAQLAFGANAKLKTQEAFKAWQTGGPVDEATAPLLEQMGTMLNFMDGIAERGGIRAEDVNFFLQKNGIKDLAFKPFTIASSMDQVKAFEDIEDPLDFMSRLQKSYSDAATYSSVADSFSSLGSRIPLDGHVRISNVSGSSRLAGLIDKDMYYPREMVGQLAQMQRLEDELAKWSKADNSPVLRMFDKITRGWKTGMTVIRPGHHARNLFSDVVLTGLDGVLDPRAYQQATRVLSRHKGNMKADEELTYLSSLLDELPEDIRGVNNIRVGKQDVSDDALYRLAHQQGLFPGYQILEDLTYGETKKSGVPGIRQMVEVGGRVSEWESNYTRMAHFIGAIKQEARQIKTKGLSDREILNLAAKRAGDRVRKWHPDGSDLTGFERGVMRRASMFYSWNRKSIPLIVQAAVTNPGKVMVLPKANYNMAMAMGVDPESLSNPFPEDQLFPDYITAALTGPQFKINDKYFRAEPGDPFADTVEQWGGMTEDGPTAALTALGTLNPILRIPLEFASAHKFQTNSPMQDRSDYVDSQIPIVNTLSSLTNRSITGLGAPKSGNVLGYDSEGKKVVDPDPSTNWLTAVNWLTGAGLQDLSKPNMIKGGQYDYRDAIVAANEAARGR